ncbi:glycosyltransferase family 87 protein [Paraburkholderia aspalathi]|uniref:glycosyltransferase family 87 protein n=1 Tax=Paraburkholderia aspalathi TaxID=1324617 RepID=UPI001BA97C43|nr:glycosyltransferase family 87 protein [Paraburkholderia aspalathi]
MYFSDRRALSAEHRIYSWLTRERVLLYSCVMLVLNVIVLAAWGWSSSGFMATDVTRPGVDFSVFWTASHMMLNGSPAAVYDYPTFARAESTLFGAYVSHGFLPWLYPPTLLLLVTPLALLPYTLCYVLFVCVGGWLFATGTLGVSGIGAHFRRPQIAGLVVLAYPGVYVAAVIGQNALLTAALMAFAVRWTGKNPVLAGICIGLLAIKPQLAVLFPVVLVAARAWKTMWVAAISVASFAALSVLVCGTQSLHAFAASTSFAREFVLESRMQYWFASPTPFAALRLADASVAMAYVAQGGVALIAAVAACYVWKRTDDLRMRAAALAVATLLANPYLWFYELTWLGVALACIAVCGLEKGWRRGEQAILVAAWLLPLYEYLNRLSQLPQIGPVVLLLVLLAIVRRVRLDTQEAV